MAAKDIRDHQFTSEKQPKNRRSRKGVPNRATVYKRLLKMQVEIPDISGSGKMVKVSLYDAAALGVIKAAMEGNTRAWIEIQDTLFGKQGVTVTVDLTAEQLKDLTDEQLEDLLVRFCGV